MTTEDLQKLAVNHEDDFINFLDDWHGHHTPAYFQEHFSEDDDGECEIYKLLNQPEDCTIKELVDAFEDEDGEWSAWENYLKNQNII